LRKAAKGLLQCATTSWKEDKRIVICSICPRVAFYWATCELKSEDGEIIWSSFALLFGWEAGTMLIAIQVLCSSTNQHV